MVEENRTGFGQVDIVDDDNMIRLPRQRIVDMYKNAMSRVRVLEAKANEATMCIRCNLLCDKRERTDQDFHKLVLREKCLLRKLTIKEQEIQDYAAQLTAMRNSIQSNSISSLKCSLQDPAVNLLIQKLRQDLCATKIRLEETQSELNAWKFTPDSNTGKRLMAKCRLLYQENEELGKVVNSGRVAKLEGELALQKNLSEEVKKSQSELDDFLQDLDEDVEGMQSTIYFLQNELQKCKASVQSTNNSANDEKNPKSVLNGIKKDDISTTVMSVKPKIEIQTQLVKNLTKPDNKSSKTNKPKDSKQLTDDQSKKSKAKKIRPSIAEGTNQNEQPPKVHKSKHKSDGSKNEEKRKKSEKRPHSKGEVVHKKSKSELPKNVEVNTPVDVVNGLPNGS
ncbi:pre-mRNA-splicing regulator female-lethal(2)D-like isoform X1 [Melanaphis sacchari]|uniref:Pre-mRNA-splicing regulator female-lethal(2)D n=2 Tax=Melanaphis sacchari TaxID=742174 RepID=A0A2H8U171_9HEMI|nr:pre-mRNA-splicing regulator female-lethal(2)D-like isoform X1 [Melanaphis sacchari]XP_025208781.1 pre-mRNA-splicing regulator female-lethal(2)D-like isoform X1 [Melanaphis sacchari]